MEDEGLISCAACQTFRKNAISWSSVSSSGKSYTMGIISLSESSNTKVKPSDDDEEDKYKEGKEEESYMRGVKLALWFSIVKHLCGIIIKLKKP